MNNTLGGLKGRLDIVEEKNSDLEDIAIETIQNETKKRNYKKIKNIISDLWDFQ